MTSYTWLIVGEKKNQTQPVVAIQVQVQCLKSKVEKTWSDAIPLFYHQLI